MKISNPIVALHGVFQHEHTTTVETQLRRMNDHFPAQIGDWSQRICTSDFGVAQAAAAAAGRPTAGPKARLQSQSQSPSLRARR